MTVPAISSLVLGTYRITYTVTNLGGLVSDPVTRAVIVRVTIPPVVTLLGSNPMDQQGATPYVEPGYTAVSAFYGTITGSVTVAGNNFNVMSAAGTSFNLIYSCTDASGNTGTAVRIVRIIDTVAPVIYLIGNTTYYQQANQTFVDPGAYANDTLGKIFFSRLGVLMLF